MLTAFVSIPHFPAAVEVAREPRLRDLPLIIGDSDRPKRVYDCSPFLVRRGVVPGLAMRRAKSACPEAVFLPPDYVLYGNRWRAVLDALEQVSPLVEDGGFGSSYVDLTGLAVHYGGLDGLARALLAAVREASGLQAALGAAAGKFTAFAAARGSGPGGYLLVPAGGEGAFLAPLDVSLLPVELETVERLRALGIETIGQVASISLPALQMQLGAGGRRLWQLANAIDEEGLRPRRPAETLEAALSFESPVSGIDVLVAAATQLLSRLRLPLRGRAARELTLQAELVTDRGWEKRLVFREALSESARLAFVLRSTLIATPPPAAVRGLSLRLAGLTGEAGKQLALGQKGRLQNQLEEAVRQLKARYGHSPIYRCVDVESWSVVPEDRQVLVEADG